MAVRAAQIKNPAISPICTAPGPSRKVCPRCAAELLRPRPTYYRLVKAIEDDPQVDKQATKTLARFMSLHPHNIAQKTPVTPSPGRHRIQGQAKAVVTSSRLHAVKYKQAFDAYLAEHGYSDIKTLVAFSGTVVDEAGLKYTEPQMNTQASGRPLSERELPTKCLLQYGASGRRQIPDWLQPLLHTMYVDKKLSGVAAV